MPTPDGSSSAEEERIQRILRQVEERLRRSLPEPLQPLAKTEQEVWEIGEAVKEIIERETLDAATEEAGSLSRSLPCGCGQSARYVAHRSRQLVTRNGVQFFLRAYYHCRVCHQGFCPLDGVLEIGRGQCSVGVRALLARFASYLPFRTASEEMGLICGVLLSARTVQREAQAVGRSLQEEWADNEKRLWEKRAVAPTSRPSQLQISMDGVLIFVGGEWKEVKLGAVYQTTTSPCGEKASGVAKVRYYATLASSSAFGRRVRTLAQAEGAEYCRKVGVVADGGAWIWQETGKYFTRSTQILDFYHACQHLWEVAHARFGEGSEAGKQWMDKQKERLLSDHARQVLADVGRWEPTSQAHQTLQRQKRNYLQTHLRRMRYQTFREQGYHIGSGVIEAGCKQVVQARMKRAGTRWSPNGAEAMLHLCAAWNSTEQTHFNNAARLSLS